MNFLQTIKSSVYNPQFYESLKKKSLGSTIKYFFLLILIVTLLNVLLLSYSLLVQIPQDLKVFINQAVTSYPSDLVVEINNGIVSTNAEEPFFVPFPATDQEASEGYNNLIVIDTKTPYSAAQFTQYKTVGWLTRDSFFYQSNNNNEQRSMALTEIGNFILNKDLVNEWVSKASPWLNAVGPLLMIFMFLVFFIGLTFKLLYFFILAALIFILSAVFKWELTYKTSYITAIYAATLGLFMDTAVIATSTYTGFTGFPFLFTLITLCVATVNLQNSPRRV